MLVNMVFKVFHNPLLPFPPLTLIFSKYFFLVFPKRFTQKFEVSFKRFHSRTAHDGFAQLLGQKKIVMKKKFFFISAYTFKISTKIFSNGEWLTFSTFRVLFQSLIFKVIRI